MKYLLITLAIISMAAVVYTAGDCKNPLSTSVANKDNAPDSVLSTPADPTAEDLKICPGLKGKKVCCSASSFKGVKEKVGKKRDGFSKKR